MKTSSLPTVACWIKSAIVIGLLVVCLQTASSQEPARQLVQNTTTQKRIALVIGNGAYTSAPPLKNPPNDARDMAATLRALGFDVTNGINVSQRDMKRLIREFGQKLRAGGSGLFFYAGHGVQSSGRNYLIPVDADIQSEAEVEDSSVDVSLVLNYMDDAQNGLNIVILDACRNNPFARSFRSASDGLAQVDAPTGTLIAYATAPGRVASDGTGQNGLYTSELLKQMRVPGLSATEMFMRVRAEVMKQTASKQVPWEASSLVGTFYFNATTASLAANGNVGTNSTVGSTGISEAAKEQALWEAVKDSNELQDFRDYLARYPNGAYVDAARVKVRRLEAASRPAKTNNSESNKVSRADPKSVIVSFNPQLTFTGRKNYQASGETWTRYYLAVTNRGSYPAEMFAAAPNLPPCGTNKDSSRTWEDIYDGAEKRLIGFCAVLSADGLGNLWFNVPAGQAPPSHVFIVLTDRLTNQKYKSDLLAIP